MQLWIALDKSEPMKMRVRRGRELEDAVIARRANFHPAGAPAQ